MIIVNIRFLHTHNSQFTMHHHDVQKHIYDTIHIYTYTTETKNQETKCVCVCVCVCFCFKFY